MVRMLAVSVVDRGFKPRSGHKLKLSKYIEKMCKPYSTFGYDIV
jgi:hypothetical protein